MQNPYIDLRSLVRNVISGVVQCEATSNNEATNDLPHATDLDLYYVGRITLKVRLILALRSWYSLGMRCYKYRELYQSLIKHVKI